MSEQRTPAQLASDQDERRAQLTKDLDELATRLNPKTKINEAANSVKAFASSTGDKAKGVVNDAKAGDSAAMGILAGVAVVVAGAVFLLVTRRKK